MASLAKARGAEFTHQYFLVAAETYLQIFRFVIGALRSVSGRTVSMIREITEQGTLELRSKIRAAEDADFCGFRILGKLLTTRIWWFRTDAVYYCV